MANGPKADLGPLRVLWDAGTLAGLDDQALLARFVEEGSGLAFEGLVRRHGPIVLRVCSQLLDDRHAAEDAFQAVFVVLARRAGSIRRPERLAPWLHGVALRTARESRSRETRRRQIERRGSTMPPTETGPPERPLIRAEEAEALHVEVARLPERYRGPVVLCDLEGLTHQEAASRLCCPVGTVAIRLKRARERLRDRLTRRGIDPTAASMVATPVPSANFPIPSATLIEATVRASTTAGLASASVISLARGVQTTMTIAKRKAATAGATLALTLAAAWGVASGLQAPAQAERKDGPPPAVPVRTIEKSALKEVRDYEDYLGRAEPSRVQEIRAQVDGILEKAPIADGAKVKANDLLFEIDPKPYRAELELAEARVAKIKALKDLAATVTARKARLRAKDSNLVTEEEVEKAEAELLTATKLTSDIELTKGLAKIRLAATQIRATFDGEVIRRTARLDEVAQAGHTSAMTLRKAVSPGDAIKAGETILARLVATDPMAVVFDVDERTILKLRRLHGDDKAKTADGLMIRVALLDEAEFSLVAQLESLPARLDPAPGTGRFRATVPNPDHRILPGVVARVRLMSGPARKALVVPQSAIMTGERGATVYAVDDRDVVEERVVQVGQSHGDLRVILEGLKPGDRVLAGDLKGVQPGKPLKP